MKELLFSLTKDDFEFQVFRAGGKGGQKQNKTSSGVRCIHRPSGAVGEGKDLRDQHQNKKNAFIRCTESSKFKAWLKVEIAKKQGSYEDIQRKVNEMMLPSNLKIEYFESDLDKKENMPYNKLEIKNKG
jgi:protein subunit release factor B